MKLKYQITVELEFTGENEEEIKKHFDVAKNQGLVVEDLCIAMVDAELEDFKNDNDIVNYEVKCTIEGYNENP